MTPNGPGPRTQREPGPPGVYSSLWVSSVGSQSHESRSQCYRIDTHLRRAAEAPSRSRSPQRQTTRRADQAAPLRADHPRRGRISAVRARDRETVPRVALFTPRTRLPDPHQQPALQQLAARGSGIRPRPQRRSTGSCTKPNALTLKGGSYRLRSAGVNSLSSIRTTA